MCRGQYILIAIFFSLLMTPHIAGAQPNFKEEETTVTETQQYFEGEKAKYRYYLNEAVESIDDPETEEDESAPYREQLEAQQEWDDQKLESDLAHARYSSSVQGAIDQQSEQCPEKQICKQKIAMLETLAYVQEIECAHQEYTGGALARCKQIAANYRQQAKSVAATCTTYPDNEMTKQCREHVANMQMELQETSRSYQGEAANRPQLSFNTPPYPNESETLDNAYTFNRNEVMEKKINETGERNMKDEYGDRINTEEDVRDYYKRNYSNAPY